MELSSNIYIELRQIAPAVANIGNNNPYTVPMGYFDLLSADIMLKIRPEAVVTSANPYSTPMGYFDGLASNILDKIKVAEQKRSKEIIAELEEVAPLLNTIDHGNLLSVPYGYFEAFTVHTKKERNQVKVVSIGNGITRWLSYAAAASIIFILSASSYLYINHHMKSVDKSLTIEQRLATLGDDEIFNYLQNDLGDPDPNNATQIEEDPQINNLLMNISDEEIERFSNDAESVIGSGEEIIKGI